MIHALQVGTCYAPLGPAVHNLEAFMVDLTGDPNKQSYRLLSFVPQDSYIIIYQCKA